MQAVKRFYVFTCYCWTCKL